MEETAADLRLGDTAVEKGLEDNRGHLLVDIDQENLGLVVVHLDTVDFQLGRRIVLDIGSSFKFIWFEV
jgi:hypothetical protein